MIFKFIGQFNGEKVVANLRGPVNFYGGPQCSFSAVTSKIQIIQAKILTKIVCHRTDNYYTDVLLIFASLNHQSFETNN